METLDFTQEREACWHRYCQENLRIRSQSEREAFMYAYDRAYLLGRADAPGAGIKADRAMVAAMAMHGLLSNSSWMDMERELEGTYGDGYGIEDSVANDATAFADALMKKLDAEQ